MLNPQRGEVGISVDGRIRPMRLTLGALAALEDRLDASGLVALAERFEAGTFGAADLIAVITAGLNGGGWEVSEREVADLDFDGGVIEAASSVTRLLAASFRGI